jgi:hypothetical protein
MPAVPSPPAPTTGSSARSRPRIVPVLLASVLGFALLWHVLPLLAWSLGFQARLASQPNGHRLRVERRSDLAVPDSGWTRHAFAGAEVYAPAGGSLEKPCRETVELCMRSVENGKLSISRQAPPESLAEMVNLRAPDERDLSITRSSSANWATIRALRDRVTTARATLDSWRYTAPGSIGVVAESELAGRTRYVVIAYPRDAPGSGHARMIGISGVDRAAALRIIGSIRL